MEAASPLDRHELVGEIAGRRATALAEIEKAEQRIAVLRERVVYLRTVLADCDAAERLLTGTPADEFRDDEPEARALPHGRLRKEIVAILKAAYPATLKASDVGQQAAARLGVRFHPKTPGMTLSRLRKDGIADLLGRRWRYVPDARPPVRAETPHRDEARP